MCVKQTTMVRIIIRKRKKKLCGCTHRYTGNPGLVGKGVLLFFIEDPKFSFQFTNV